MPDHDYGPLPLVPDLSELITYQQLESAMALGTAALGTTAGYTFAAPAGADIGMYGSFHVPQDYAGTPRIIIAGLLEQASGVLGFGVQQFAIADTKAVDVAYEAEDLGSISTWTSYAAEDLVVVPITITPAVAFEAFDRVYLFVYRDDSVDTQTLDVHDVQVFFRYSDS